MRGRMTKTGPLAAAGAMIVFLATPAFADHKGNHPPSGGDGGKKVALPDSGQADITSEHDEVYVDGEGGILAVFDGGGAPEFATASKLPKKNLGSIRKIVVSARDADGFCDPGGAFDDVCAGGFYFGGARLASFNTRCNDLNIPISGPCDMDQMAVGDSRKFRLSIVPDFENGFSSIFRLRFGAACKDSTGSTLVFPASMADATPAMIVVSGNPDDPQGKLWRFDSSTIRTNVDPITELPAGPNYNAWLCREVQTGHGQNRTWEVSSRRVLVDFTWEIWDK